MDKKLQRRIRKWVTILLIVYVTGGVLLYFFQEKVLFQSEKLPFDHVYAFGQEFREFNVPVNKEKTINMVQFLVPDSLRKGVVLYFHGNRRNVERYAPLAPYFTKNNYEVWMMDYPGFGKSTGKRSEQILYDDAMEVYKIARARFGADSIVIYGKSLGTGIAAQLASRRDAKRLILETPYYDYHSVVRQYLPIYPLSLLLRYELPTHTYLERIGIPITIFQGTDDRIVTYSNAKKLIPVLKKTDEFVTVEGASHNNLYEFPQTVHKLDSLLSLP